MGPYNSAEAFAKNTRVRKDIQYFCISEARLSPLLGMRNIKIRFLYSESLTARFAACQIYQNFNNFAVKNIIRSPFTSAQLLSNLQGGLAQRDSRRMQRCPEGQ